jgi:hypothetical protein
MDYRLTFLTKKYTYQLQTGLIPAVLRFFFALLFTQIAYVVTHGS